MTGTAVTGLVRTVLGDVDPSSLGVVHAHEHLFMTGGWPVMREPDWRLDSMDAAVEEVSGARAAGLGAVVEMTPLGFGRWPGGLIEVARRTGLAIVATTGFHKSVYYSDAHWIHRYPAESIAGLLVDEIETGMDAHGLVGPLVERSPARAGVVKIATGYHTLGKGVARLAEAVAQAARTTGVAVATHNDQGTMGHELLDTLEKHGVPAGQVVLGHIDHNPDPGLLGELAARGAYLAFDMPGRVKYAPDAQAVELFASVVAAGGGDRLLLGTDLARRSYWRSLGGGPGLSWLLARFVPRLEAAGLGDAATAALTANAHRAFALRAPRP